MAGRFVLFVLLFAGLCCGVQLWTGVYHDGRSLTADEAAHFTNSLLIVDWLRHWPLQNPLHYAQDYYVHYPRVSIGHWPPLFYAVQAAIFAVAGRSTAVAVATQAFIGGLACGWPAYVVYRRAGLAVGLAAGLFALASPSLTFLLSAIMLDTVLGVLVFAAALSWAWFASRPGLWRAVVFAAVSSAAILVKGNGYALALVPLLYAALRRDVRPLRHWSAWVAALLVGVATLPWYALTWRMISDGFNYRLGYDYTSRAVPAYVAGLVTTFGVIGLIGLVAGFVQLIRRGRSGDETIGALAVAAASMLIFQLVAPADLSIRYLVAMVPAAAPVAAMGWVFLLRSVLPPRLHGWARGGAAVAGLLAAGLLWSPPHASDLGMPDIARAIIADPSASPFVLAAGSIRAEGALIAAFAEQDHDHRFTVLRATQMLGAGGFMGTDYAARFATAAELGAWLKQSGIGWVVLERSADGARWAHNGLLGEAAKLAGDKTVSRRSTDEGSVEVFRAPGPAVPSPEQAQALLARVHPNTMGGQASP